MILLGKADATFNTKQTLDNVSRDIDSGYGHLGQISKFRFPH